MNVIFDQHDKHLLHSSSAPDTADIGRTNPEFRIAIVGGGFCGTTALVHILQILIERQERNQPSPKLFVDWFDQDGRFGRGLAYQSQDLKEDSRVLILNQPASLMSPFSADPGHYVRWLGSHYPEYSADSFTPRTIFGEYLEETLREYERAATLSGAAFEIQRIHTRVARLSHLGLDECLSANGTLHSASAVILASGHARVDQFGAFSGNSSYIDEPFNIARYRAIDLADLSRVIIVGGGPSSMDAIRTLEEIGYKGSYVIAASRSSPPWPFHPRLYSAESFAEYRPQHLVPGNIPENPSLRLLHRLLGREIRQAWRSGFGCGHALYGIPLGEIAAILNRSEDTLAAQQFGELLAFLRGNITAPENVALRSYLRNCGRLTYARGHAEPTRSYFDPTTKRFVIPVTHRSGRLVIAQGELLINCALYPRSQHPDLLDTPFGAEHRVIPVGPALIQKGVIPRTWGVESFRDEVRDAARKAFLLAHHQATGVQLAISTGVL
jgi:hypothetical protein